MSGGDGGDVSAALDWRFSQVFGERAAGEEVQEEPRSEGIQTGSTGFNPTTQTHGDFPESSATAQPTASGSPPHPPSGDPNPLFEFSPVKSLNHAHHSISIKLTPQNYLLWSNQLSFFLQGQGIFEYVTGELSCPPPHTFEFRNWNCTT